ncbi:hypothetical protein CLOM_g8628 [Closterium sp. NIES-68]|nr:hypothetical protein CLOM_g8628 [Closterium sp. NIES-68]GJP66021.1 hypothetical protein CLOP_g22908 [Closterium sp. NIES-67]
MLLLRAKILVIVFVVLTSAFAAVHWPLRRSWRVDFRRDATDSHAPLPSPAPIAVCLVGSARAFEATGPSLLRHILLPARPSHLLLPARPSHLFLHAPLDETAAKLSFLRNFVTSSSSSGSSSTGSSGSNSPSKESGREGEVGNSDVAARDWARLVQENAVASVRIFPNSDVDETKYPTGVMYTKDSPSGLQGLLQYFRLVEGCWDMIQSFEATSAREATSAAPSLRYPWIVRARLDSLWTAPAPIPPPPTLPLPLPLVAPAAAADSAAGLTDGSSKAVGGFAYTVPYGWDWWGLNDRFGAGGREASGVAMRRLRALHLLERNRMRDLNSERAFKAQLALGNVKVQRANVPFCVLSRRTYWDGCAPTVFSINSSVLLNGAKCRPCSRPCATGDKARALIAPLGPSDPNWPGPGVVEGEVGVCDAARGWEGGWEGEFDAVMGEEMAAGRRQVVLESMGSIEECVKAWDEFHALTVSWDAPSSRAVCVRARLGGSSWVGGGPRSDGRFATFISLLAASSKVVAMREGQDVSSSPKPMSQGSQEVDQKIGSGGTRRLLGQRPSWQQRVDTEPNDDAGAVAPGTVAPGTVAPGTVAPGTVAPGRDTVPPGTGTVVPVDMGAFRAWTEDLSRRIKGISISHRPVAWLLAEPEKEDAPVDVILVPLSQTSASMIAQWSANNRAPPVCQLLLAASSYAELGLLEAAIQHLGNVRMQLEQCAFVRHGEGRHCTFYSELFCTR